MLSQDSYHIYMCTGLTPPGLESNSKKISRIFNNILRLVTILLHVVVMAKIKLFKVGYVRLGYVRLC
jgi:hypothetical protein